jgi:hypothetical protein
MSTLRETDASGVEVDVRPLDSFDFGGRVAFMKIDVELHEREVLDGAMNTIKENLPVVIMEDQRGARNRLLDLGYTAQRIALVDWLCRPPGVTR